MNPEVKSDIASPCINICRLDGHEICTGCGRSLDEIIEWSQADPARKRQILQLAEARRRTIALPIIPPPSTRGNLR